MATNNNVLFRRGDQTFIDENVPLADGQIIFNKTDQAIYVDSESDGTVTRARYAGGNLSRSDIDMTLSTTSENPVANKVITNAIGNLPSLQTDVKTNLVGAINEVNTHADTAQSAITAEATARQSADNTLQGNINSEAATRASADTILGERIDQIIAPSGEAPSAAEVTDARIGYDSRVYTSLGDAIREQTSVLHDVSNAISGAYEDCSFSANGSYPSAYSFNTTIAYCCSNLIKKGQTIQKFINKNNITTAVTFGFAFIALDGKCIYLKDMTGFVGKIIDINYIAKSDGYLMLVVKSASAVQLAFSTSAISDAKPLTYTKVEGLPTGQFPTVGNTYTLNVSSSPLYPSFTLIVTDLSVENIQIKSNKYYHKKIAFLGDSLTAGYLEGGGYVDYPYPTVCANDLELESFQNLGVSSSSISPAGNPTNPFISRISNINSDTDYVVIMGGTNDHIYATPLGDVTDTTDETLCGAMNILFNGIQAINSKIEVIFVIPIQKSWIGANRLGLTFNDYLSKIKEMCDYCSIRTINAYDKSGLTLNLTRPATLYGSGLHLTAEGYVYLGHRMAEMLKNV